ncbi:MAG: hypothetical protein AAFN09_12715 [Pseudomonadota bacterium]
MKKLLAVAAVLSSGFMAVPAAACPDWQYSGRSNLGTLGGQFLYTPRYWSVVAGGNVNLANCAAPGTGYVISQPDFEFTFNNDGGYNRLELSVQASCDTVLLVNDANGNWHFNDDTNGLQPQVNVFGAPSGVYDVWIGTYGSGNCQASLELETWY